MKPKALKSKYFLSKLLKENGLGPNKNFGQNFMVSSKALKKILKVIGEGDLALEIGGGLGTLTQGLAHKFKKVISLEIDKNIFPLLKENLESYSNVKLINIDALKFSFSQVKLKQKPSKYILCGNIPYNISSPLIRKFLIKEQDTPERIVFLVQKEFAEKIVAKRNSLLKISLEVFAKSHIRGNITKDNFFPKPKIDSSILEITPHKNPKISREDFTKFFSILEAGFGSRRKFLISNLAKNLKVEKEGLNKIFNNLGISDKSRAEDLSLKSWLDLFPDCQNIQKGKKQISIPENSSL